MNLSALDDTTGTPVDWWFMYKLPHDATPIGGGTPSTGYEYLYVDSTGTNKLTLSNSTLDANTGALHNTLQQLYPTMNNPNTALGWIMYNDEMPFDEGQSKPSDNGELGHTKGVLAFDGDTNTAFWLLHSTPRFPHPETADFPMNEKVYGQTYLCVTLKDVATLAEITKVMTRQQEPQVYSHNLPAALEQNVDLTGLLQKLQVNDQDPPEDITFYSQADKEFRLIAKNRHWNDDFWNDLVGPKLDTNLSVETWRRGTLASTTDNDKVHDVVDVLYINLESLGVKYEWHYTKDHAKWAVSLDEPWVCIADINRDKSQEKRGGGSICFQNTVLWEALSGIETTKLE